METQHREEEENTDRSGEVVAEINQSWKRKREKNRRRGEEKRKSGKC